MTAGELSTLRRVTRIQAANGAARAVALGSARIVADRIVFCDASTGRTVRVRIARVARLYYGGLVSDSWLETTRDRYAS